MRLRSIHIKGFKSFAQETLLHFNEPVIGIVGPNGSGKSNIIDAIRWVLGEQKTTELRLESMSNVLFNGTKKRKASNQAHVAISFENDRGILPLEFKHITISRTLYRTGNSEYKINDVVCRLKDIHALLANSGIGSDSYAIIALGMVDDILSDKDQARRKMFEQAAGITLYKARKKETLQKLNLTLEDLNRVEDLLAEIGANMKSLEKQAKRTQRYLEVKLKYKELSIRYAIQQLADKKSKHQELEQKIRQESDDFQKLEAAIRLKESELEKLKTYFLKEEETLQSHQKGLSQIIGNIKDLENRKELIKERKIFTIRQIEDGTANQSRLKASVEQLKKFLDERRTIVSEERTRAAKMQAELEQSQLNLNTEKQKLLIKKSAMESVLEQQKQFQQALFEFEKRIAVLNNTETDLIQNLNQGKKAMETRQQELEADRLVSKTHQQEINILHADLQKLESAEYTRLAELDNLTQRIEEFRNEFSRKSADLSAIQNEFDLTKSLVENLEGYPESIKFLNKQKEWMEHAILLSDIIYCDDKYRISIENYLEPYLNYFIVSDRKTALSAVSMLSNSQKGKANFFILSAFEQNVSQDTTDRGQGLIRASSILQVDSLYEPVLNYLLRNVYLTEDESHHQSAASFTDQDNVILNMKGDIVSGKRWISGGSVGLFEGKKIGRKKNLEKLEAKIQALAKDKVGLERAMEQTRNQQELLRSQDNNTAIAKLRYEIRDKENLLAGLQARIDSNAQYVNTFIKQEDEINNRLIEVRTDLKSTFENLKKQEAELLAFNEECARLDVDFIAFSEQVSSLGITYNQLNIAFIQQNAKLESFVRELEYKETELAGMSDQIIKLEQKGDLLNKELVTFDDQIKETENQILVYIQKRTENESTLNEFEKSYYSLKAQSHEIESELREQNKQLINRQSLINQLKEAFNDLRFQMESVSERMEIEFGISKEELNAAKSNATEEPLSEPEGDLREEIEKIRGRLQGYQDINPLALEAYEEIRVRFEQIEVQRDDILAARDNLLATIEEIDSTATTKFLQAFEQVRHHFVEVFRSLFTEEDFCDLVLENPEAPLESAIHIIARPKGKRPQTLHQLSGGEKTLTAIALLFSFYLLKPAPFCVFDEVDAPLDDANIEKFNKIIKKFSKDSQFIVVTHNKGTMAEVDTIYGVYMEEQGVSGLSKVDFRKFAHEGIFESVAQ